MKLKYTQTHIIVLCFFVLHKIRDGGWSTTKYDFCRLAQNICTVNFWFLCKIPKSILLDRFLNFWKDIVSNISVQKLLLLGANFGGRNCAVGHPDACHNTNINTSSSVCLIATNATAAVGGNHAVQIYYRIHYLKQPREQKKRIETTTAAAAATAMAKHKRATFDWIII